MRYILPGLAQSASPSSRASSHGTGACMKPFLWKLSPHLAVTPRLVLTPGRSSSERIKKDAPEGAIIPKSDGNMNLLCGS